MRFMVQLLLAFFTGLVLGYVLLSLWDVMGSPDPFATRYGDSDAALRRVLVHHGRRSRDSETGRPFDFLAVGPVAAGLLGRNAAFR